MDEIFGLALQTNAIPSRDIDAFGTGYNYVATANDLSDMFMSAPLFVKGTILPAGGGFQLTFSASQGQSYQVLSSSDLTAPSSGWTVVGSGTFWSTNATFTDTNAVSFSNRFYKVVSP
jgi:hypothetical protein